MSCSMYAFGTLLLLAGVLYIGHMAQIPQNWMICVAVSLLGLGIISAATITRSNDPS